ncbi:MAG: hypothetical protein SPE04_00040 [Prevotella sp.]|nr:hypothetical protein [Prevotella sp.]
MAVNEKLESLKVLHECLWLLPRRTAKQVARLALRLNYEDGQARMLNRKTLEFHSKFSPSEE